MDAGSGAESVVTLNEKRVLGPRQEESGFLGEPRQAFRSLRKKDELGMFGADWMALKASRFTSAAASWDNNRYASPGLSFTV